MSRPNSSLRRLTTSLTTAAVLGCAGACASASRGAAADPMVAQSSSEDVIAADRLQSSAAPNVYDAIKQIRPQMLNAHNLGTPDVYIGNVKQRTGLDRLKELPVVSVEEVRLLPYAAARSLPGEMSEAGALVVTLR